MQEQEQNRTEPATEFKLKEARKRGLSITPNTLAAAQEKRRIPRPSPHWL